MSRAAVAVLASAMVLAAASGEAARRTKTTSSAKTTAAKRAAAKKAALAKKKKLAAKHSSRGKHHRRVAVAEPVTKSKEGMPNGFAWPPNQLMKEASVACEQHLDQIGLVWERATPEGKIADPIKVPSMEIGGIKYTPAYSKGVPRIDCQLVQTLAEIGPSLVAIGVREIRYGSIYRNTNVRVHGMTKPILSRHALGIAMDIKAFVDDKGRVANVELDYLKGDPLLHGIEDTVNASKKFRIVLTPGNDPLSHYDHFHIEAAVDFTAFR
ncbi:MAG TPA: extensin family protein [Kofleriaceae bacterium]